MVFTRSIPLAVAVTLCAVMPAYGQDAPALNVGGTTYTKFLFGNQRDQGATYNFTTVPGEGYGDTGIGSEIELLLNAKLSRQVEVNARLHSRFSQNQWTNFGGFGGTFDPSKGPSQCAGGSCGELDPRSNQYIKLRGVSVVLTPGYLIDSAVIGANDFGQFDPFVIGRVRYIDRDNTAGILVQGSGFDRRLSWDAVRISLPRLWAGPAYSTGDFHADDAAYGLQARYQLAEQLDLAGLFNYVDDRELDARDTSPDNGRLTRSRFRNVVGALKAGWRYDPWLDVKGAYYYSYMNTAHDLAPRDFNGISGFSPVPVGRHVDSSYKLDVTLNDPFQIGLSLNIEGFSIGADYVSIMAARRESDVLLTEGHDATFAFPGPSNANFGVFGNNATRIGYGGWSGTAQQVATINVDNEFTDFDEPMAETVIGWKGVTFNPVYTAGLFSVSGEYSYITYNTNWQAYGDDTRPVSASLYPSAELDTGVGHNFRSAYQPFQDKTTHILVANVRHVLDVLEGVDVFGKVKYIYESDKRLNDPRYLPYQPGDCPGNGVPCSGNKNYYSPGNTTADIYSNPDLVTVDGATGYRWKPFDNIADDDRELHYASFMVGAGYQVTDDLYLSLAYAKYLAELQDGTTALQGYNLHEMASGSHDKNQLILRARYVLAGIELGMEGQYNFGTFVPRFGASFIPQVASTTISQDNKVPAGSAGFSGRFGGWNSLEPRYFSQLRMKAFIKAQF